MNSDDVFIKNEARIFQHIQDISDNESEKSFSDLINDYTSSRFKIVTDSKTKVKKDQTSTSDDDSFEKVDMNDVLPPNKKSLNLLDEPLKFCEVEDLMTKVQKTLSLDSAQVAPDIKKEYTKKKMKEIDKKQLDRPQGSKTERSISQVSSLDMEDFDENLVLPQEIIIKWAVQLLLTLEKLHTLDIICR